MVSTEVFESSTSFTKAKIIVGSTETVEETENHKSGKIEAEVKCCELVDYDSLPGYLKDNEFILSYYRCEWPLKQTILSIFSIHNETLNIWTHLIGFFVFLVLAISTAKMIKHDTIIPFKGHLPRVEKLVIGGSMFPLDSNYSFYHTSDRCYELTSNVQSNLTGGPADILARPTAQPIAHWPFFTFMFGAMSCLLASSAAHLLSCHSKRCSYIVLRLDYIGISVLIVTSFYPLVYYSFMCDLFFRNLYTGFITAFGVATAMISLLPAFQSSKFRPIRSALYFSMGISAVVPILHKLVVFDHQREALLTAGYELLMGVFYAFGVAVYTARVPERWMPGKCDLAGQSHQLFHICVVAGAYTHYLGGLVYLEWRDAQRC